MRCKDVWLLGFVSALLAACSLPSGRNFMEADKGIAANALEKPGYKLVFNDEFNGDQINTGNWIPFYLPQWSSRERSKPEYRFDQGNLVLLIKEDQQPWCPEFNGEVKVSSLQTGLFSGELGSDIGQHKFNPSCLVREAQQTQRTYTPQYGYIEIRAKAVNTASNVVALWMIGFEDTPDKSAEICIVEIKGQNVQPTSSVVGYGVRAFNDPALYNEFYEEPFALDTTQFHIYGVDWSAEKIDFYIDNQKTKTIYQSPNYPMQLMLNIYEVPVAGKRTADDLRYPKEFVVDYVRGYQHR
jgi:hypothetical protein